MTDNALSCLVCAKSNLVIDATSASCSGCGAFYPILRGAIDFRNVERDLSAGYDFEIDNLYAAKLSEVFDEVTTVSELRRLLYALRSRRERGIDLSSLDPRAVLREDDIRPIQYSAADAAHGRSILEKIPLYLEGSDLPDLPTGVALEDGAGEGYFVSGLSERFRHVFVLDLSMTYMMLAAKIIEELGLTNVTLMCASAEHLPLANGSIEFVHSNNVIEHVTDQGRMISEANRVLHPSGLLFMMSPNRFSLYFEPHFRLPGFGFFPEPVRRRIIRHRQGRDVDDIKLRSLGELRRLVSNNFDGRTIYSFIPRRLRHTVTGGTIRTTLTSLLNLPGLGGAANFAINRIALGLMPYHVVLGAKQDR